MPFRSLFWTFAVNFRVSGTDSLLYRRVSEKQPSDSLIFFLFSKDLSLKCAPIYVFEARSIQLESKQKTPRLALGVCTSDSSVNLQGFVFPNSSELAFGALGKASPAL